MIAWGKLSPSYLCVYKQGISGPNIFSLNLLLLNLEQLKYVTIWNKTTWCQSFVPTYSEEPVVIAILRSDQYYSDEQQHYISFHFKYSQNIVGQLAESFTKLMKEYSVNHVTSSPHYPHSNGLVEKYVQIIKNLFYKAQEEVMDLYKSFIIYRNTPLSSQLQLPMQILQS